MQKKVYNELGVAVLKNAWEGYNSTLFAYGQTGSGKSWSVVGYGINKGMTWYNRVICMVMPMCLSFTIFIHWFKILSSPGLTALCQLFLFLKFLPFSDISLSVNSSIFDFWSEKSQGQFQLNLVKTLSGGGGGHLTEFVI